MIKLPDWTTGVRFQTETEKVFFATPSGPALGSAVPSVQWVRGWSGRSVNMITHLHLVPRLMRGAILHSRYVFMALCLLITGCRNGVILG